MNEEQQKTWDLLKRDFKEDKARHDFWEKYFEVIKTLEFVTKTQAAKLIAEEMGYDIEDMRKIFNNGEQTDK